MCINVPYWHAYLKISEATERVVNLTEIHKLVK